MNYSMRKKNKELGIIIIVAAMLIVFSTIVILWVTVKGIGLTVLVPNAP